MDCQVTAWKRVILEKLKVSQRGKKFRHLWKKPKCRIYKWPPPGCISSHFSPAQILFTVLLCQHQRLPFIHIRISQLTCCLRAFRITLISTSYPSGARYAMTTLLMQVVVISETSVNSCNSSSSASQKMVIFSSVNNFTLVYLRISISSFF